MTNAQCLQFCGKSGYAYAGTEYSTQCFVRKLFAIFMGQRMTVYSAIIPSMEPLWRPMDVIWGVEVCALCFGCDVRVLK